MVSWLAKLEDKGTSMKQSGRETTMDDTSETRDESLLLLQLREKVMLMASSDCWLQSLGVANSGGSLTGLWMRKLNVFGGTYQRLTP